MDPKNIVKALCLLKWVSPEPLHLRYLLLSIGGLLGNVTSNFVGLVRGVGGTYKESGAWETEDSAICPFNPYFIRKLAPSGMPERQSASQMLINNWNANALITSEKPLSSHKDHAPSLLSSPRPSISPRSHQGHQGRLLHLSPHIPWARFLPKLAPTDSLRKATGEEAPESEPSTKPAAGESSHCSDRNPLQ